MSCWCRCVLRDTPRRLNEQDANVLLNLVNYLAEQQESNHCSSRTYSCTVLVGTRSHLSCVCRCVLGDTPRRLDEHDANVLVNLAELVVRQLEKDHLLQLQRLVRHISA